MRRLRWLGVVVLWLSVVGIGILKPLYGEFGVGLGNVEEPSLKASARFNEALSSFHLMLAALDRKDQDAATKYRNDARQQFKEAADFYGQASSKADNHTLKATANTPQERDDLKYFTEHAGIYEIKEPISQKALITAISNQVSKLGANIGGLGNSVNLRRQQGLANLAAELQRFLSSATTLLRIG